MARASSLGAACANPACVAGLWEDREALHHELRRADVVVLCYATDEPTTFDLLEVRRSSR